MAPAPRRRTSLQPPSSLPISLSSTRPLPACSSIGRRQWGHGTVRPENCDGMRNSCWQARHVWRKAVPGIAFLMERRLLLSTPTMAEPVAVPAQPPASRGDAVAAALGHRFADQALLLQACMHTSRCGAQATPADKRRDANERLEFLGDAVLGAALCQLLYRRFPALDEGPLSRLKSTLVSRATLARAIEGTGLLAHCLVGQQMSQPWPDSVKANFAESLLGAI